LIGTILQRKKGVFRVVAICKKKLDNGKVQHSSVRSPHSRLALAPFSRSAILKAEQLLKADPLNKSGIYNRAMKVHKLFEIKTYKISSSFRAFSQ
jgi:hypothetical protein